MPAYKRQGFCRYFLAFLVLVKLRRSVNLGQALLNRLRKLRPADDDPRVTIITENLQFGQRCLKPIFRIFKIYFPTRDIIPNLLRSCSQRDGRQNTSADKMHISRRIVFRQFFARHQETRPLPTLFDILRTIRPVPHIMITNDPIILVLQIMQRSKNIQQVIFQFLPQNHPKIHLTKPSLW